MAETATATVTDEVFRLEDVLGKHVRKPDPHAKPELMVNYGGAGTGKTFLAGTAQNVPGFKKGLIIDTERSTVGVITNADFWDVIYVNDHEDPLAYFEAIIDAIDNPNMATDYDVIVIDTLDIAQDWAIDYYVHGAGCPRTRSGEADTWKGWGNIHKWTNNVADVLKRIKPLGIINIHDREVQADTGAITQRLRLSGGAKDTFASIPDMVIYLERRKHGKDGVQTTAFFGTDDNKVTKDRFGFPPAVQGVTIPYLYRLIDERETDGS